MTIGHSRTDLEGLRAVAICCGRMSLRHPALRGWFHRRRCLLRALGYLITGLIAQEVRDRSRLDLAAFYARRARRLLPACAVVIIATSLVVAALFPPDQMAHLAGAVRAAGLYFSNVCDFILSASDYFAPAAATNPLLHTWSLGVEEQFYLFWPVLLVIVAGKSQRWNRVRWVLLSVAVASLTCSILATHAQPSFAFYELPARGWEFAAGGFAGSGRGRRQHACGLIGSRLMRMGRHCADHRLRDVALGWWRNSRAGGRYCPWPVRWPSYTPAKRRRTAGSAACCA